MKIATASFDKSLKKKEEEEELQTFEKKHINKNKM